MPTIVDKAALNNNGSRPLDSHSTFPLNQQLAGGYRFGLYQPCSVDDTVPSDRLPLKTSHELRTMNIKGPLLGDVKIHKEFIDVPFSCMLPLNYEKVFVQPNIGEDVDASEVGLNVENLPGLIVSQLSSIASSIASSDEDGVSADVYAGLFLRLALTLNSVFSTGSLMSSLGEDLSATWKGGVFPTEGDNTFTSIDRALDQFFIGFRQLLIAAASELTSTGTPTIGVIFDGSDVFQLDPSANEGSEITITYRQFLERAADASSVVILGLSDYSELADFECFSTLVRIFQLFDDEELSLDKDLLIARPLAYQLACAEFFTNSHVDYIYSAELYRQNVDSLMFGDQTTKTFGLIRDTFSWNGVDYLYDTLSAHNFKRVFALTPSYDIDEGSGDVIWDIEPDLIFDFYRLIFGFNRSLRYVDYFTGSRTRPLAVGDVNVQVNGGYVNIIDTIQKRWTAKFYNQVNRIGRKLSEYMKGMFPSLKTTRDLHDPMWLAHIVDSVDVVETQNTGAAQQEKANSITSNLISHGQRYAFEYQPERYGICIGIMYFDIARFYPHVIERNNFNVDRNDFFNPFLQLVGDQKVYKDELNSGQVHATFGYQGRDMQYKQKVDRCFGPFAIPGVLPGWLFIAPDDAAHLFDWTQNPSFIRAWPSEFDTFFNSLTGYSNGTYFHFLVINTNNVNASRPMIANPQLD